MNYSGATCIRFVTDSRKHPLFLEFWILVHLLAIDASPDSGYSHQQDAHEFLNFLLNELVDILEKEAKAAKPASGNLAHPSGKAFSGTMNGVANGDQQKPVTTWVHKIFQVIAWLLDGPGCLLTLLFWSALFGVTVLLPAS